MSSGGKIRAQARQGAEFGMYFAALLHLLLIEVVFAFIAFFGVLDIVVINPTTMMVLQLIAFVISLVLWILMITWYKKYFTSMAGLEGERTSVYYEDRGGALFSSTCVYFGMATILHAIFSIAWIIWVADYGDLSPLNFNVNIGPFVIELLLLSWQFMALFIALFFFIYDIRHQKQIALARSTSRTISAMIEAKSAAAASVDASIAR